MERTRSLEIGDLKSDSSHRTLPLPHAFEDALLSLRERQIALQGGKLHSPFVFTNLLGQPIRPSCLSTCFKSAAKKAGLPNMRLHDLRHMVVTYLLEAGQAPQTVQEFIGHTDPRFTISRYAHVIAASKVESANIMARLVMGNGE